MYIEKERVEHIGGKNQDGMLRLSNVSVTSRMILVYITCKDRSEARMISEHLLRKRLVACANIFPIESMYWWNGEITRDDEFVVMVKSLKGKLDEIRKEVRDIHSYDIPCILKLEVDANEEFLKWVNNEVK